LVVGGDPQDGPGAVLGLFSLVTLFAHQRMVTKGAESVRRTAWYDKKHPTFSDQTSPQNLRRIAGVGMAEKLGRK
jgi:hypothetical protein